MIFKQGNRSQGGAQYDARIQSSVFGKAFVFANDSQAAESSDNIYPAFARGLTHIRNKCFVYFERNALFQFPAKHGNRFGGGTRKLIEVLNEDANHGIRKKDSHSFRLCAKPRANGFEDRFDPGHVNDVRFNGAWNNGARRKWFNCKTIETAGAGQARSGDAVGRNFDGKRRMRRSIEPSGELADKFVLVNALS